MAASSRLLDLREQLLQDRLLVLSEPGAALRQPDSRRMDSSQMAQNREKPLSHPGCPQTRRHGTTEAGEVGLQPQKQIFRIRDVHLCVWAVVQDHPQQRRELNYPGSIAGFVAAELLVWAQLKRLFASPAPDILLHCFLQPFLVVVRDAFPLWRWHARLGNKGFLQCSSSQEKPAGLQNKKACLEIARAPLQCSCFEPQLETIGAT